MAVIGANFWGGPLGVIQLTFNDQDLGKTNDQTTLDMIEDIKDIFYQQDGTQPAEKIRTGQAWQVSAVFAEIDTDLIDQLVAGTTKSGDGTSVKLGRDFYKSMLSNEAKVLILKKIEDDTTVTADQKHWLTFYKAVPLITGSINYGADVQKDLEVTFLLFL